LLIVTHFNCIGTTNKTPLHFQGDRKMKKIVLAAAALALTAGAAFAENPRVGEPADLYANDRTPVASQKVDYTAPASIEKAPVYQNGSAHRFGDASPSSYEN